MDKLRKPSFAVRISVRCDFSGKRIYHPADCVLIIGFIAAYLVGSDAVEDVISTIKETGDK
ncbi:MAG: hypothetical protein ACLR6L_03105 [Agathobaculum sp.]